jgi:uncharacterized protein YjaG (DUF416 family)
MNFKEKSLISIASLSPKKQLAFALLVFERMLPSLVAFSKGTGFDDSCYLQAKDAAWAALENAPVDESLNVECRRGAPDTEEYRHELTSFALDAALAMSDTWSLRKMVVPSILQASLPVPASLCTST